MPAMHPYTKATTTQLAELQTKVNESTVKTNETLAKEGKPPLVAPTVKIGGIEEKGILTAVRGVGETSPPFIETYESGGVQYAVSSFDPETADYTVDGSGGGSITATLEELAAEPFVQGTKWVGIHRSVITGSVTNAPGNGWLTAYNLDTGKIIWQINSGENNALNHVTSNAGTTQTGGGITFLGNGMGEETALNSENGQELWHWQLGAKTAASAAVYEWNGKEYVSVETSEGGDNLWTFALNATGPGEIEAGKTPPCTPAVGCTPIGPYPTEGPLPGPITKH
jgi:hypothetical protein